MNDALRKEARLILPIQMEELQDGSAYGWLGWRKSKAEFGFVEGRGRIIITIITVVGKVPGNLPKRGAGSKVDDR